MKFTKKERRKMSRGKTKKISDFGGVGKFEFLINIAGGQ
jgi:hypothetical protein